MKNIILLIACTTLVVLPTYASDDNNYSMLLAENKSAVDVMSERFSQTTKKTKTSYKTIKKNVYSSERSVKNRAKKTVYSSERSFKNIPKKRKYRRPSGSISSCKKHIIRTGDVLKIESCDTQSWCKVEGEELYVRGFLFNNLQGNTYEKIYHSSRYKNTYFYVRNRYGNIYSNTYKQCTFSYKKYKSYPIVLEPRILKPNTDYIKLNSKGKMIVDLPTMNDELVVESVDREYAIKSVEKTPVKKAIKKAIKVSPKHKYRGNEFLIFAGTLLSSSFDVVDNSGASNLTNGSLDTKVKSGIDLGLGYNTQNFLFTLNYQQSSLTNLDINYFYGTANYNLLNFDLFTPYLGLMAGYGIAKWSTAPAASISNTIQVESLIYGAQLGFNTRIIGGLSIYGEYKYPIVKFDTTVDSNSLLEHTSKSMFSAGIMYFF